MSDYPDLVNIPFNNVFIRGRFIPGLPHYSSHTLEPGYWVVIQDNNMILQAGESGPNLPMADLPDWLAAPEDPLAIGLWHGRPLRIFPVDKGCIVQPPFIA